MSNIAVTPAGPTRFVPQTARADIASAGGGGKGLIQAGQDIIAYGDETKKREENADVARVNSFRSQALVELSPIIEKLELDSELGTETHIEDVKKAALKHYADNFESKVTTGKGRSALIAQRSNLVTGFVKDAIRFQSASASAKVLDIHDTTVNNYNNYLLQHPDRLDETIAVYLKETANLLKGKVNPAKIAEVFMA